MTHSNTDLEEILRQHLRDNNPYYTKDPTTLFNGSAKAKAKLEALITARVVEARTELAERIYNASFEGDNWRAIVSGVIAYGRPNPKELKANPEQEER